mmetsp:Transcript_15241/g.22925  ORF Transcript_15241/g.22925 Transcript_15241/m.22925 type:complete len:370 (+) Transcript_15241:45-1154(+)
MEGGCVNISTDSRDASDCDDCERKLCYIVRIKSKLPIPNADNIVLAEINGISWQCIIKKDEFQEGDLAIYYAIDSVPDFSDPNTALVKSRGNRIKTIKLRGVISQGLLAPLSWLADRGHSIDSLSEGEDVTDRMGVTKYIHEEEEAQYDPYFNPDQLSSSLGMRTPFPAGVPKTNENRLQENPRVLEYIEGRNIVITRKEDGCSATYVLRNDEFSICGRNFTLLNLTAQSQHYFEIEDRYNIQSGMKKLGRELAIQGEIVGPKINGNRMKLSGNDFRVFNIKDLMTECYLSWEEVESVCASLGLHTVPVIYKGISSNLDLTVEGMLRVADEQRYAKNLIAEGIVVKTNDGGRRCSFKVISNKYLLKYDR